MKVGFTGTRDGMTREQFRAFRDWIKASGVVEFHHGCCLGADSDAWEVVSSANDLGFDKPRVVAHMPENRALVSYTAEMFADKKLPPLPYLDRNRAIVDACDVLVACPKGPEESRSGTWSTVRYARKCGKSIIILWPDGRVTRE